MCSDFPVKAIVIVVVSQSDTIVMLYTCHGQGIVLDIRWLLVGLVNVSHVTFSTQMSPSILVYPAHPL